MLALCSYLPSILSHIYSLILSLKAPYLLLLAQMTLRFAFYNIITFFIIKDILDVEEDMEEEEEEEEVAIAYFQL